MNLKYIAERTSVNEQKKLDPTEGLAEIELRENISGDVEFLLKIKRVRRQF